MNDSKQSARCSHCNIDLPVLHQGPCPHCGKTGKTISVSIADIIQLKESLSIMRERREIIRENPWLRWVLIFFDLASLVAGFFVAQWIGLFIGLLLVFLGEVFGPKTIIRIMRDHWQAM